MLWHQTAQEERRNCDTDDENNDDGYGDDWDGPATLCLHLGVCDTYLE
jgi:hypothetical protein